MKPLVCDLCGGKLVIGSGGIAVCDSCGMEHTKERVQEKVQEIKGIVQIDNSIFVENQLQNARRALSKEDWEAVEKYYNIVEQHQPKNIEAVFFSAYGRSMLSLSVDEFYSRQQKFNVLEKSISLINEYNEVSIEDNKEILLKISKYIIKMLRSKFTYDAWKNSSGTVVRTNESYTRLIMYHVNLAFITELLGANEIYSEQYPNDLIIKHCEAALSIPKVSLNKDLYIKIQTHARQRLERIVQKEKEEAKEREDVRIKQYWEDHSAEKAKLDAESQSLEQQIADFGIEIKNLSISVEENGLNERIIELNENKKTLGLFKTKDRKVIQKQIDTTVKELEEVKSERNTAIKEIKKKIRLLEMRQSAIDLKLKLAGKQEEE